MAKTILKYKSIIFEHLCGKYNFASIQTIRREEAHPIQGYTSNHDTAVPAVSPLCIQMVIQANSRSKMEFITQALRVLDFSAKTDVALCSVLHVWNILVVGGALRL